MIRGCCPERKSTYFLSVWLAICLLEGLLTRGTCCCMCSQQVSPKKTIELKYTSRARESVFVEVERGGRGVCVHVLACVSVILFGELSK